MVGASRPDQSSAGAVVDLRRRAEGRVNGQRGGGEDNGGDGVPEPHAVDLLKGLDILLCGAVVIDGEGVRVVVVRGQDLEVPAPDGTKRSFGGSTLG